MFICFPQSCLKEYTNVAWLKKRGSTQRKKKQAMSNHFEVACQRFIKFSANSFCVCMMLSLRSHV